MKPNAIVVAEEVPESSLWYLTPGKEYEAEIYFTDCTTEEEEEFGISGYLMVLVDDAGDCASYRTGKCPHLGWKPWRIVKVMNVAEVEL